MSFLIPFLPLASLLAGASCTRLKYPQGNRISTDDTEVSTNGAAPTVATLWVKYLHDFEFAMGLTLETKLEDIQAAIAQRIASKTGGHYPEGNFLSAGNHYITCEGKLINLPFTVPLLKVLSEGGSDYHCHVLIGDPGGVAGGSAVDSDEWKSKLDFIVDINDGGCTGAMIGSRVITAAHCCTDFSSPSGERPVLPLTVHYTASFSLPSLKVKTAHSGGASKRVVSIERHPDFEDMKLIGTRMNLQYDVCVLTVESSALFIPEIRVIMAKAVPKVGSEARIAGFGETDTFEGLRRSGGSKIEILDCPDTWSVNGVGDGNVCAGSGNLSKVASCRGDSGAPWFQLLDNDKTAVVLGVHSFSYRRNGERAECGDPEKKSGLVPVALSKIRNFLSTNIPAIVEHEFPIGKRVFLKWKKKQGMAVVVDIYRLKEARGRLKAGTKLFALIFLRTGTLIKFVQKQSLVPV